MNMLELKTIVSTISSFSQDETLKVPDFDYLNFYVSNHALYFIGIGSYLSANPVKLIYKVDYEPDEELVGQVYSVNYKDLTSTLQYMTAQDTTFTLYKEHIVLDSRELNLTVKINRFSLKREINDYLYSFIFEYLQSEQAITDGVLIEPFKIEKIENQLKLRTETSKYISFGVTSISTVQFNYITDTLINIGIQGRLPMPVLKHLFALKSVYTDLYIKKENDTVIFYTPKLFLKIEHIDMDIKSLDSLTFNQSNLITLNKQEIVNAVSLINTFSKENTGYFVLTEDKLIFKNSATEENQVFSAKVDKEFILNHSNQNLGLYSFDIKLLQGLLSILEQDDFQLTIEKAQEDDESYLLFIVDTLNKNILSIDNYS